MKIYINDEQKKLLLETLAVAHQVEFLKGKDNSELEKLIEKFAEALKEEGREDIFNSVFMEIKQ